MSALETAALAGSFAKAALKRTIAGSLTGTAHRRQYLARRPDRADGEAADADQQGKHSAQSHSSCFHHVITPCTNGWETVFQSGTATVATAGNREKTVRK